MASEINHSRRAFLRGRVAGSGSTSPGTLRYGPAPRRPPWALPEAGFLAACTRCGDCAAVCPTKVIQIRDGYPQIDFTKAACTFCAECVRACSPAALRRVEGEPPWRIVAQPGTNCLADSGVECRICGEQCEAEAIRFNPRFGLPAVPEVLVDRCTGCGACVAPCPTRTIVVA